MCSSGSPLRLGPRLCCTPIHHLLPYQSKQKLKGWKGEVRGCIRGVVVVEKESGSWGVGGGGGRSLRDVLRCVQ